MNKNFENFIFSLKMLTIRGTLIIIQFCSFLKSRQNLKYKHAVSHWQPYQLTLVLLYKFELDRLKKEPLLFQEAFENMAHMEKYFGKIIYYN